jgi:hypothetical protein
MSGHDFKIETYEQICGFLDGNYRFVFAYFDEV